MRRVAIFTAARSMHLIAISLTSPRTDRAHIRFYNSPIMSDVTVHFNGKVIAAHKIILCLGSPYFTRLFDNESTVSSFLRLESEASF
jgi:hypothetical protein